MEELKAFWSDALDKIPRSIGITDIVEIIILAVVGYQVILWFRDRQAWTLLKGIAILMAFYLLAVFFKLNTIVWLVNAAINYIIIAFVVIFQPEIRKAVEQLGRKRLFSHILTFDNGRIEENYITDRTINEIARAAYELGKTKTGALIVIQKDMSLAEYERTGIEVDAIVTSQLLINIFEHNTPLHDGAVIVRGNRVTAATCYLPLSDNTSISKELGTRQRAGIGISEVTDSYTVIVSEETGATSLAAEGVLKRNLDSDTLKAELARIRPEEGNSRKKGIKLWKGRLKSEKNSDK